MWVGNIISMMNESRRVETKASTPNYSLFGNKMKTSKSTILESVGKFGEFGCNCVWYKKFHFQSLYKIIVLNFLYGFGCMIRIKIVTCLWAIIQSFRKYSRSLLSFLILILIKNIYLMQAGAWCPSFDGNKKRSSIWQQTLIKMPLGSLKCIYGRLFLVWKKAFFNNAVAFCFFKRRGFFLYYDNSLAWKLTLRWPMLHWILCMH